MSFFRRIGNAALSAATNVVSGVASGTRRLVSAVVPEAVQRRVNTFTDWVTSYVAPTQINQVLDEITEHVRRNYPQDSRLKSVKVDLPLGDSRRSTLSRDGKGMTPDHFFPRLDKL